jgi:flagellar biogenesis protein FliO
MGSFVPTFFLSSSVSTSPNLENPWIWGKVIVFLFVLCGIALALKYFSKQRGLKTVVGRNNKLRIIETCSLGNRQFIVVTQYESEKHLLAVSTTGVSHLAKLANQDQN